MSLAPGWTEEERNEARDLYVFVPWYSVRRQAEWEMWERREPVSARPSAEQDPVTREWLRPDAQYITVYVTGTDDESPVYHGTRRVHDCWACRERAWHSTDYHGAQLADVARHYVSIREDDLGVVWMHYHEGAVGGWDE